MLLYRGPSRLDPTRRIVVVAVGFDGARNSKTGPGMVQIYIMPEPSHAFPTPAIAARAGEDASACGQCPLRGAYAPETGTRIEGTRACYVHLGQGPAQVAKALAAGVYEDWTGATAGQIADMFADRGVRLGAYGDPAAMPVRLVKALVRRAAFWTGYTHSPERAPHLKAYCMASAHSPAHALALQAQGWRTFRVAPKGDVRRMAGELLCPASKAAGHKLQCGDCQACDGHHKGRRANVMIPLHAGANAAVRYAGVLGL